MAKSGVHSRLLVVVVIALALVAIGSFAVVRQRDREDKVASAGQATTSTTAPSITVAPVSPAVPDTSTTTLPTTTPTTPMTLATTPTTVALGQSAAPDSVLPHTGRDAPFGVAVVAATFALVLAALRRRATGRTSV